MYLTKMKNRGFSLLEMLLAMAIVSGLIYMVVSKVQQDNLKNKMDISALQMEQILSASMAYYLKNGQWPTTVASGISVLRPTYIPNGMLTTSPWNNAYTISAPNITVGPNTYGSKLLYVWVGITTGSATVSASYAKILAGRLPSGFITNLPPVIGSTTIPTASTCSATTCYVVSSVGIPLQNLQNSTKIQFAGLYHHGGCVPVPDCPVDKSGNTMTPQIMVTPVSVSGMSDGNMNVYPISSFTAYATGGTNMTPTACTGATNPLPACNTNLTGPLPSNNKMWRVCLQVITEKGALAGTANWGNYATLLAVTRCAINNEPAGSTFSVYSN